MSEVLEVPISGLTPGGALTGAEIFAVVQGGVTKRVPLSDIASFIGAGPTTGGGVEITEALFPGVIAKITSNANYSDVYGSAPCLIGGYWNGVMAVPTGPAEHDYYVQPIGTPDGFPRHIVTFLKVAGTLKPTRVPYLQ